MSDSDSCNSEESNLKYFFATACVTQESDNNYTDYVNVNRSIKFTLDSYPSEQYVISLFEKSYVTHIEITSLSIWSRDQYNAW